MSDFTYNFLIVGVYAGSIIGIFGCLSIGVALVAEGARGAFGLLLIGFLSICLFGAMVSTGVVVR